MEFKLPELGEGVHEGELVSWKVKVGDMVRHDQPICEVMTDKATIEIPAPFDGKVTEISAKEGQTIKVGQTIVKYEGGATSGKAAAHSATSSAPAPTASAPAAVAQASAPAPNATAPMAAAGGMTPSDISSRVLAAPSTRKAARERGIDLGSVAGSGPHGRVMREDLDRSSGNGGGAMAAGTARPSMQRTSAFVGREERIPFKGLRKKIAEKMIQSKHTAAHFTYVEEANATELVKLRAQAKEIGAQAGVKVTYLPFLMKAMVAAIRQYPHINSSLDDEKNELVIKHFFNIGLSVQTDDGLVAPVIKDVEHKSILELARDIQAVVDRARAKRLSLDDLQGGTVTLTNAGSIGGLFTTPVINYPEVAILGFNKIFKKPVVETINGADQIVIRDWTYFSISLDHRVVDGAIGAEFMKAFIRYVETPSLLLLESF